MLVMSNLYELKSGSLIMSSQRQFKTTPLIKLGDEHFKKVFIFWELNKVGFLTPTPAEKSDINGIVEDAIPLVERIAHNSRSPVLCRGQVLLRHLPAIIPARALLIRVLVVGVELASLLQVVVAAESLAGDSIVKTPADRVVDGVHNIGAFLHFIRCAFLSRFKYE